MTPEGKTVVAYVRRWLTFDGLISGTKSVSPEWVVLNRPYRFPPPAQLRRMPIHATMSIDALSLAHGITDRVSLIVTGTYIQQDTTGLTFAGLSGTTRLGTAPDPLDELGDSRVGANFKLYQEAGQTVIGSLGVFIPTGSQKMGNPVLTPSGAIVYSRGPYSDQTGTGTYDLSLGLTWNATVGSMGWGMAYRGRVPLEAANDEGYRVGDQHLLTGWVSYRLAPFLSASLRIEGVYQDHIHGRDPKIAGPGSGADPLNFGGERIDGYIGLQAQGAVPVLGNGSLGVEYGLPMYERANGVHLERKSSLTATAAFRF